MLVLEVVWLRRLYKATLLPLAGYWIWWEWPLQWSASAVADLTGAVIGTAGFLILFLEGIVVMVLFVPGRVKYLLEKGKAQGRAEARAELEKALEEEELSEKVKAKILSSIPAVRESS